MKISSPPNDSACRCLISSSSDFIWRVSYSQLSCHYNLPPSATFPDWCSTQLFNPRYCSVPQLHTANNRLIFEVVAMTNPDKMSLSSELGITHLRFEGGTVVIYLSDDTQDILVLPLDVLVKNSDWFKSATHINWHEPQMLEGGSVRVYQFVLSFDSEFKSWTLQSKVCSCRSSVPVTNPVLTRFVHTG